MRGPSLLASLLLFLPLGGALPAGAHDVYLLNDNHTDYNWNAPAAVYDQSMLSELDFYRAQVDATALDPADEQSRYTADNWWYLYLYEHNRSPSEFADLLAKMRSGHITIPLNPFVTLYGAMSTEMAIRAGYYPGRIARAHDVDFLLAYPSVENNTVPWGIASIFSGSGARYAWKGVCACVGGAPQVPEELFHWLGPDDQGLLMKWYQLLGANSDRGGYAEARDNLNVAALQDEIATTQARQPGISVTGLFGAGWDDVSWESTAIVQAVTEFNDASAAASSPDRAVVSNGIDFFQALEASGEAATLPTLKGGWGADWDMWPASLAERTARQRRAIESLRTAEALAALAEWLAPGTWAPLQASLEAALTSTWKYFEHGWATAGGPSLPQLAADKEGWTQDIEAAVESATATAEATLAAQFATPDEDRVAVFNPLAFERTDVVDLPVPDASPRTVIDVATGAPTTSQIVTRAGESFLRWLATDVPSLGYRSYRIEAGAPPALPDAATVDPVEKTIESERHRLALGLRGQITSALDKAAEPDRELAGSGGLADWGSGSFVAAQAENVGPVSATLHVQTASPSRSVRVTLYAGLDRIDVEHRVLQNVSGFQALRFHTALPSPQIHFEEVGAIARPGLVSEGGDYLPGTRADRLTVNHFLAFATGGYQLVVSNQDSYAMRVGNSTKHAFDLPSDTVHVLITDAPPGAQITDQGGDDLFLTRFALRGIAGAFSAADALRTSLAHQNALYPIALPREQNGPLAEPLAGFLSVEDPNVVVTAVKPVEEASRGLAVRAWELGGGATSFSIDAPRLQPTSAWETTLIETDLAPIAVSQGGLQASLAAHQLGTWRFVPTAADALDPCLGPPDADADYVSDACDRCTLVPDPDQADADGDGFGDRCDCDFDDDGLCNLNDFNLFLVDFVAGQPTPGLGTDMDGDGLVGLGDFDLFLIGFQTGSPGPSAFASLGAQGGCGLGPELTVALLFVWLVSPRRALDRDRAGG